MEPLFILLLTLAAPSAVPGAPSSDPPGWKRIVLAEGSWGGPAYSIAVPSGVQGGPVPGIDSAIAVVRGKGLKILFDYGPYGGYQGCTGRTGCAEREETIAGHVARIATSDGPNGRKVTASIDVDGLTVDLFADCAGPAACARAVEMIRTIRFSR